MDGTRVRSNAHRVPRKQRFKPKNGNASPHAAGTLPLKPVTRPPVPSVPPAEIATLAASRTAASESVAAKQRPHLRGRDAVLEE